MAAPLPEHTCVSAPARTHIEIPVDGVCEWLVARHQLPRTWRKDLVSIRSQLLTIARDAAVRGYTDENVDESTHTYVAMKDIPLDALGPASSGVTSLLRGLGALETPRDKWERGLQTLESSHMHIADVGMYLDKLTKFTIPARRAEVAQLHRRAQDLHTHAQELAQAVGKEEKALQVELETIGVASPEGCEEKLRAHYENTVQQGLEALVDAASRPEVQRAAAHALDIMSFLAAANGSALGGSPAPTVLDSVGRFLRRFEDAAFVSKQRRAIAHRDSSLVPGTSADDACLSQSESLTCKEARETLICDVMGLRACCAQRLVECHFKRATGAPAAIRVDMIDSAPVHIYHAATDSTSLVADAEALQSVIDALSSPALTDALLLTADKAALVERAGALVRRKERTQKLREKHATAVQRMTREQAAQSEAVTEYNTAVYAVARAAAFVKVEIERLFPTCDIAIAGVPDPLRAAR